MKRIKIDLHIQILIGLLLGIIFGLLFPINQNKVTFEYIDKDEVKKSIISNYDSLSISIIQPDSIKLSKVFKQNSQKTIITFFEKNKNDNPDNNIQFKFYNKNKIQVFNNIVKLEPQSTLATIIKPLGTIFINLLTMLAIPLVLTTLIVGSASLGDTKTFGKIGATTLIIYIFTTMIALTIGVVLADFIKPGLAISQSTKDLISLTPVDLISNSNSIKFDIFEFLTSIFTKNIFASMVGAEMLQIVFFALFFGLTLLFVPKTDAEVITNFLNALSNVLIKMVELVMKFAPIGVFALISFTIADFGISILQTLLMYVITVVLGLFIHTIFTYGIILKIATKKSIFKLMRKIQDVWIVAFSTSSSAATLPVTIETAEKELKIPRKIASFVLPLGATINMDGTGLYQGVAAIFIAQFYGMDLSIAQQLTIIFMAVLASIGTAPVPGVGLIMLIGILQSVGIPLEGIGIILGVDRILDMLRTITNVTGDMVVASTISQIYSKDSNLQHL